MARKMRQVTADFQKWEKEGDTVEGVYQGTETVPTEIGPMVVGKVLGEKGIPLRFVMGEGLQRDFAEIKEGQYVSVKFLEKVKTSKGMNFNRFVVLVEES